jgi:hypothetical protein
MAGSAASAASDESQEQQFTRVYAEHIYTSLCAQEYRNEFSTEGLSPADKAQLNTHTLGACKCLYNAIAARNSSSGIIDYVMYAYGLTVDPMVPDPEAMAYYNSSQISNIGEIVDDEAIRKKCGFIN